MFLPSSCQRNMTPIFYPRQFSSRDIHILSLSLFLSVTRTHCLALLSSFSQFLTLLKAPLIYCSPSLSLSLSLLHTLTHTLTHNYAHAHTHDHSHPHTLARIFLILSPSPSISFDAKTRIYSLFWSRRAFSRYRVQADPVKAPFIFF